jgi:hypothetical protein
MNLFSSRIVRCTCAGAVIFASAPFALAQVATVKIVKAAETFLSTLTAEQRKNVTFAFDDAQQRTRWSNFPITIVPRAGIPFKDMSSAQRTAAMALLASALSPKGLEKVQQIMDGDEVLKAQEGSNNAGPGNRGPRGGPGTGLPNGNGAPPPGAGGPGGRGPDGPGGGGLLFGKDLYYFSILGTPSEKTPWMLQFGGHHLALNITIVGAQGILTPTLTGAQPALYTLNGKTIRPLGAESDKALALLNTLDDKQRKAAIIGSRMADLVLGPGQDGKKLQPEGLKATTMSDKQRTMLLDVISEWAGIIEPSAAAVRMAQLKADINETWFAWSGPTTAEPGKNIAAYYRIQGPHLVIEYSPQSMGGDPALHVHTMYRDPTNDYGEAVAKK